MKMKDLLDSAHPMKKHKLKEHKAALKKKKQSKRDEKQQTKIQKANKAVKPTKKSKKDKPSSIITPEKNEHVSNIEFSYDEDNTQSTSRQRVSKSVEPMTKEEQLITINQIIKRLLLNDISQGMALRELRVNVLGLRQDTYTQLTGISRKTLSELENDKGNYTAEIINKAFKPFDIRVGLVPNSSQLLSAIMAP